MVGNDPFYVAGDRAPHRARRYYIKTTLIAISLSYKLLSVYLQITKSTFLKSTFYKLFIFQT